MLPAALNTSMPRDLSPGKKNLVHGGPMAANSRHAAWHEDAIGRARMGALLPALKRDRFARAHPLVRIHHGGHLGAGAPVLPDVITRR